MPARSTIPAAEAIELSRLVSYTEQGISSRVILGTGGGNVTLFAFDEGQELSEHTVPYDAIVLVFEGTLKITVGGTRVRAATGTVVRMPANVPHAVESPGRAKMMLVLLRGRKS